MKPTTHVPKFSNNASPAEMSQALALAHATRGLSTERTPIQEPPGKNQTAITLEEKTKGDAGTSRRSASDTARSAAPGSSSPDAAVEQRHL
ncbi:MAG: hypothetical protein GKS01_17585 [Alphaproteobacteria bacterium]|nr:hypothetical protein [Alphaproteobacteria bacterium]